MSLFKDIDGILELVAERLQARLTINRPSGSKSLHSFEERRIDWEDNGLNKAIIIQPYFSSLGVDSTKWSFVNIAWVNKDGIAQQPGWLRILVENDTFVSIESNINELLEQSIRNLESVDYKEVEELIVKSS